MKAPAGAGDNLARLASRGRIGMKLLEEGDQVIVDRHDSKSRSYAAVLRCVSSRA
ncbi:MAG: hypothetical protein WCA23_22850 [Stellaceae bacterium]